MTQSIEAKKWGEKSSNAFVSETFELTRNRAKLKEAITKLFGDSVDGETFIRTGAFEVIKNGSLQTHGTSYTTNMLAEQVYSAIAIQGLEEWNPGETPWVVPIDDLFGRDDSNESLWVYGDLVRALQRLHCQKMGPGGGATSTIILTGVSSSALFDDKTLQRTPFEHSLPSDRIREFKRNILVEILNEASDPNAVIEAIRGTLNCNLEDARLFLSTCLLIDSSSWQELWFEGLRTSNKPTTVIMAPMTFFGAKDALTHFGGHGNGLHHRTSSHNPIPLFGVRDGQLFERKNDDSVEYRRALYSPDNCFGSTERLSGEEWAITFSELSSQTTA